jgi:hypothetical protein
VEPEAVASLLLGVLATGRTPVGDSPQVAALAKSVRERLSPAAADADAAAASGADGDGFEELAAAVRDLTVEESAVLSATAQRVADALWGKLASRMEEGLLTPEQRGGDGAGAGAGAGGRASIEGGGGVVASNASNGARVEVAGEAAKTPEPVVAMAR